MTEHTYYYSFLPDRDPGGFIRTGSSIPPEVFSFGWVFLFLTPGVFIQTEVFLNCWMMLLYGPRFFGTEPEVLIQPVVPETCIFHFPYHMVKMSVILI